jgi:hypothetical protein
MPRPRKSIAQARLTGAYAINPARYAARSEPLVTDPLGEPPDWLTGPQRVIWRDISNRMPWLNKSHRGITGIAAILQAKLADGALGLPGMNLLRMTLGQMGATPATAQHAVLPEVESDDPTEQYFR